MLVRIINRSNPFYKQTAKVLEEKEGTSLVKYLNANYQDEIDSQDYLPLEMCGILDAINLCTKRKRKCPGCKLNSEFGCRLRNEPCYWNMEAIANALDTRPEK